MSYQATYQPDTCAYYGDPVAAEIPGSAARDPGRAHGRMAHGRSTHGRMTHGRRAHGPRSPPLPTVASTAHGRLAHTLRHTLRRSPGPHSAVCAGQRVPMRHAACGRSGARQAARDRRRHRREDETRPSTILKDRLTARRTRTSHQEGWTRTAAAATTTVTMAATAADSTAASSTTMAATTTVAAVAATEELRK